MRNTLRAARPGITVLELLIVIGIISMLGAMTISAVFKVRAQQDVNYTEVTLKKLVGVLDQNWKAVCDQARKEYDSLPSDVRSNLISLADNPPGNARRDDRARLLYLKFRLKQEFPVAFAEVVAQSQATRPGQPNIVVSGPDRDASMSPSPLFLPTSVLTVGATKHTITAKPTYFKAVMSNPVVPRELESSILLLMALEQSRAGVPAHNMEQVVGSRFIGNQGNYRYLLDAWGKPLQFFTFPAYQDGEGPSSTDLDIVRTTTPFTFAKEKQDPADPERLLVKNDPAVLPAVQWIPATVFPTLLHRQMGPPDRNPGLGLWINRRLTPVIASAGADGDIGGAVTDPGFKWMKLPQIGTSADNIYSYRLRQTGARGE